MFKGRNIIILLSNNATEILAKAISDIVLYLPSHHLHLLTPKPKANSLSCSIILKSNSSSSENSPKNETFMPILILELIIDYKIKQILLQPQSIFHRQEWWLYPPEYHSFHCHNFCAKIIILIEIHKSLRTFRLFYSELFYFCLLEAIWAVR